jgi:NACHT domain
MAPTPKPRQPAKRRRSPRRDPAPRPKPADREEYVDQVAGDEVTRDKIGKQINLNEGMYIEGNVRIVQVDQEGNIKWNKVQFTPYLHNLQREFTRQIQRRTDAGTLVPSMRSAASVYVPPLLSRRHTEQGADQTSDLSRQGTWDELVHYPCLGLLVGDTYDGKSLLLRKVAADLAAAALRRKRATLPIYLPIDRVHGTNPDDVLAAAAFMSGQDPRVLRALWDEERRPVCLLIDGLDDVAAAVKDQLVAAIADLNQRRKGHSIVVACRPGPVQEKLTETLAGDPLFTELVMLPLTDEQIDQLLNRYGAHPALAPIIHADANLRRLVSKPGLLAGLVRAVKSMPSIPTPKSMAELYRLLIDEHLFGTDASAYQYQRVKRPVLAYLAQRMLCRRQNSLPVDDALCADIAHVLTDIYQRYDRSAKAMPADWQALDLLKELQESPVMNQDAGRRERLEFASSVYRDYYAAVHLKYVGQAWPQAAADIKSSNLEAWMDALMLLSGMETPIETDNLLEEVFALQPQLAADLWLEKSAIGLSRPPSCIASDYRARLPFVPTAPQTHPAQRYLSRLLAHAEPSVNLNAVAALAQLGTDAIDPLLDACETGHALVIATAIHALLHLGEFVAYAQPGMPPLLHVNGQQLLFNNLGAGNASLGPLTLVQVPRTFRAELTLDAAEIDFDPFSAPSQFELWHTPVAWFALDYFGRAGVNWIGLAGACSAVARCANLINQRGRERPKLAPVVDELTQCLISYDRLGFRIATDLGLPWQPGDLPDSANWLVQAADQVYGELRLFFSRTNRPRMLSLMNESDRSEKAVNVSQTVGSVQGAVQAVRAETIDLSAGGRPDIPDVPSAARIQFAQTFKSVTGGQVAGISIGQVSTGPYLAAETLSLRGSITIDDFSNGQIAGIVIDKVSRWNGIRARLSLTVGRLIKSQVVGIQASLSPETLRKIQSGG